MVYCPVCGTENPKDVKECKNCHANLDNILNNIKSEESEYNLLKISGYVFIILGLFSLGTLSIVGLILGYKTYQQNNSNAKTHGIIIVVLNIVVILFWIWTLFLVPQWWQSTSLNQSIPRFYR
ncbi:hypothetical protein Metbo_1415 [Methanobacterium lacus]|uniref:Zinc-ribbon domain-containing protein n=1 Tax=Methanobacterium lacus (strain AL-21) TaxID=877455 RepID=F0T828_METLA|nr:zinc ribbon domain-containing protein [Methanobacterium lacus]ADZ09654.1 hypothetical protein Metbo_1415 [Methanobacterium lacus]